MPKRSFWREMVLLGVPLVIIGGVFGWDQWQKRFRTPTIALSVKIDTKQETPASPFGFMPEKLRFGWIADLKGGPKSGYRFGWNERVVAQTRRGSVIVWQLNTPPKAWPFDAVAGSFASSSTVSGQFSSYQGLNQGSQLRRYTLDQTITPIDTQRLMWHGEMVAIPVNSTDPWQSPISHDTLQSWSQIKGAALWQKTEALPYDPQTSGPVIIRSQKSNGETHIEILSRRENKRACRRLIAFDGTTRRVLWRDIDRSTGYCNSVGNGGYGVLRDGESLSFEISRIPASWGEVIFLCDTVFDINKRAPVVSFYDDKLGEPALAAFERQIGGYRVSRRLVLRPRSTTKPVSVTRNTSAAR